MATLEELESRVQTLESQIAVLKTERQGVDKHANWLDEIPQIRPEQEEAFLESLRLGRELANEPDHPSVADAA